MIDRPRHRDAFVSVLSIFSISLYYLLLLLCLPTLSDLSRKIRVSGLGRDGEEDPSMTSRLEDEEGASVQSWRKVDAALYAVIVPICFADLHFRGAGNHHHSSHLSPSSAAAAKRDQLI